MSGGAPTAAPFIEGDWQSLLYWWHSHILLHGINHGITGLIDTAHYCHRAHGVQGQRFSWGKVSTTNVPIHGLLVKLLLKRSASRRRQSDCQLAGASGINAQVIPARRSSMPPPMDENHVPAYYQLDQNAHTASMSCIMNVHIVIVRAVWLHDDPPRSIPI